MSQLLNGSFVLPNVSLGFMCKLVLKPCSVAPCELLRPNSAFWCVATTDRGSNECQARKHILALSADINNFIYLDGNCFEHSVHLAVQSGLVLIDTLLAQRQRQWRYYSSMAIFANCCRDLAKDFFAVWENRWGCESAMANVYKLAPKCISSRWGSVDSVEERFLQPALPEAWAHCLSKVALEKMDGFGDLDSTTLDQLSKMLPEDLKEAFSSKAKKAKSKKEAQSRVKSKGSRLGSVGGVDLLAIEEMAEFAARVSRWQRHLLLTINDYRQKSCVCFTISLYQQLKCSRR